MDEQALKLGVQTAEVYRDFVASQSKLSNKDAFNCFIASVIGILAPMDYQYLSGVENSGISSVLATT